MHDRRQGRAYLQAVALWCLALFLVFFGALQANYITRSLDLIAINISLTTQAAMKTASRTEEMAKMLEKINEQRQDRPGKSP